MTRTADDRLGAMRAARFRDVRAALGPVRDDARRVAPWIGLGAAVVAGLWVVRTMTRKPQPQTVVVAAQPAAQPRGQSAMAGILDLALRFIPMLFQAPRPGPAEPPPSEATHHAHAQGIVP